MRITNVRRGRIIRIAAIGAILLVLIYAVHKWYSESPISDFEDSGSVMNSEFGLYKSHPNVYPVFRTGKCVVSYIFMFLLCMGGWANHNTVTRPSLPACCTRLKLCLVTSVCCVNITVLYKRCLSHVISFVNESTLHNFILVVYIILVVDFTTLKCLVIVRKKYHSDLL